MVIALSGVQFRLKSYAWFQNRTSAQREFDLKSQINFEILKSHNLIAKIQELQDFGQYQCLLNQVAKFAKQWLFSFIFLQCDWLV